MDTRAADKELFTKRVAGTDIEGDTDEAGATELAGLLASWRSSDVFTPNPQLPCATTRDEAAALTLAGLRNPSLDEEEAEEDAASSGAREAEEAPSPVPADCLALPRSAVGTHGRGDSETADAPGEETAAAEGSV